MNKQTLLGAAVLAFLMHPAYAATESREATMAGSNGGNGRCTVQVDVDGVAEVEVSGSTGRLRTLSGREAAWRQFHCSEPLPGNPADFGFGGINGRGTVRLLRDPRSNGGTAVIQINDPKGGRSVYTFDLQWRGTGGGGGGGWPPAPAPVPPGRGPGPGAFPTAKAIRICQDSVTSRLNRIGYPYVTFGRTIPDDGPGRNDWVIGTVSGKRGFETTSFSFSCSVDFRSGMVRSVDVRPRW
jgi:hypothetical protein